MTSQTQTMQNLGASFKNFFSLCKPRVTSLIVFTALIGMFMGTPGMVPWTLLIATTLGIAFASGAAAAFNCLIEHKIDAIMARTRGRFADWPSVVWPNRRVCHAIGRNRLRHFVCLR